MESNISSYSSVYALTGSSGSGKSSVASILRQFGAYIVSADYLSRLAVSKDSAGLASLVGEFGDKCLLENGELDRPYVRGLIFTDPKVRKKVESIIHPIVRDLALKEFQAAINQDESPIIYDVPLYFEAGLDKLGFKGSILVYASTDTCIRRIIERDHLSIEDAKLRLINQMSSDLKMKRATFVLNNSGTIEDLKNATRCLWEELER